MARKKAIPSEELEQAAGAELAVEQPDTSEQIPEPGPEQPPGVDGQEVQPVVDGDAGQGLSDDPDAPPTEPPIEGLEGGQANEGGSSPERLVPEIPPEIPEAGSVVPPFWVGPEEPALEPPPVEEHPLGGETAAVAGEPDPAPAPPRSDRQNFFALDFNELDRELTQEERQEWNSIYASYRGRSALTGTIIGVDPLHIVVRNKDTGAMERQTMYCAIVVPYRVRIVIPAAEMWERAQTRPDFVLQNMVGAAIEFIIIKVDRENKIAIGSRRLASRSQRHFFANRPTLNQAGSKIKCQVLSVGPRRCLVGCYGHDVNLTQRELSYTAIPDLRRKYHPGMELDCVVKDYDPRSGTLHVSVKETESNPFDGAEQRHPVGARRQAIIAGKYGGGVFCNLPDGTVCMCNYSYQHEDADFMVGDTVILVVQRFEGEKRQMYGKILSKW